MWQNNPSHYSSLLMIGVGGFVPEKRKGGQIVSMSIRGMIEEMRGEVGNMSKRGFEARMRHGFRSRPHRVIQDSSASVDSFKQSCWANMPPELLRDVLMRIEASEITWPPRKHVVSCAGVCRSWREIMKEIVKRPEVSGKLTFPISLKQ
ncbi:Tubby-like F-box protein 3-like protein, partial [Drosera capensis]